MKDKLKIIKRNGEEVEFNRKKIVNAIKGANKEVPRIDQLTVRQIEVIAETIEEICKKEDHILSVEDIQDLVEVQIMKHNGYHVAQRYIRYRYEHELIRKENTTDKSILSLIECNNEEIKQENSNKNPTVVSVQRDYMAGEVSKDISKRMLIPEDVIEAHDAGILHFHDMDYFSQHMNNCSLPNIRDMLENGTVISGTMIEKPHMFSTACNITTQIIAQIASSQYGGQSISLAHLAPFVNESRKRIREQVRLEIHKTHGDAALIDEIVESRVKKDIEKGVQIIQYQVITLMTTNGQAPFITVFLSLAEARNEQERKDLAMVIEEVLRQRYQGVKNECGEWITPAFPKLVYELEDFNVYPDSEYYYLTELAAKCTAKRMVPDYVSGKVQRQLKHTNLTYPPMGCRSFLTVEDNILDEDSNHKFYGRFNQGVVTINLVDVALSSGRDGDKFWKIFDERLELCHKALRTRHERLLGTPSDVAPILWQNGAFARLEKGEKIDKLLYDGYSTISLGYAGLAECVYYMLGMSHTDPIAKQFALSVMQKLNDKCAEWREKENIAYSVYGTPIESTTYRFAKLLKKRFGVIEGVTDKNYITNSYHVRVTEEIDPFKKLTFESDFQELSPGGAISYVEIPNMKDNIEAVLEVMRHIYDNIMYAELNTKSDYCQCCGYEGEIQIKTREDGKLIWVCPQCGNTDQSKMNVARRTCGYIGTEYWNQGRTQEIKERVCHGDNRKYDMEKAAEEE